MITKISLPFRRVGVESNWVHSALRPPIGILCQPLVIMMMARGTEILGENLPQCHFVCHKPHMPSGREPGPPLELRHGPHSRSGVNSRYNKRCAVQMPQNMFKDIDQFLKKTNKQTLSDFSPPSSRRRTPTCWWTSLLWFSTNRRKLKTWLTLLELCAQVEVFVPIVHSTSRVVTSGQVDHQITTVQFIQSGPCRSCSG
jgi:hypothetical protein